MHANHDCDLSCSCRASIASLQREVDRVRADRTNFSDTLERLQTQVKQVESESTEVESRGGGHTSYRPDRKMSLTYALDLLMKSCRFCS